MMVLSFENERPDKCILYNVRGKRIAAQTRNRSFSKLRTIMAASDPQITIKLFMDPGNNYNVLFAECGKDFVDFMFSFLLFL
ncbi:hypothetical protein KSP39_PZI003785 [Platanthera zijinensis]|uniref:Uncharacterized protein n=1 Tax=Platanthera zijinensis TaxID=2320716 RepID=A0AAP0GC26_9ASPA